MNNTARSRRVRQDKSDVSLIHLRDVPTHRRNTKKEMRCGLEEVEERLYSFSHPEVGNSHARCRHGGQHPMLDGTIYQVPCRLRSLPPATKYQCTHQA